MDDQAGKVSRHDRGFRARLRDFWRGCSAIGGARGIQVGSGGGGGGGGGGLGVSEGGFWRQETSSSSSSRSDDGDG